MILYTGRMKKSSLLLFLLLPFSLLGQNLQRSVHKADSIVQAYANEKEVPGMAVSIYKDGQLVFSKGYGFEDVADGVPINPSLTRFRIGSVSKTLTAAAMGVLMKEGRLDPDQIVQTYVSDFPVKKYPITVRQVAGHLAGIRHYRGSEFMSIRSYPTVAEGLNLFKNDPLLFEPGTQYSYSSYGWNLISAVIEGASGKDFLPFMKEQVFDPLGMNNTVADWAREDIPHRTTFYVWHEADRKNVEAPYVDNSYKWAGGGFIGTTEDLIRFGKAFLEQEYLSEDIQHELMDPQQTSDGKTTNYGMGWSTWNHNGSTWKGHSGGSVGGSTMFMINKEHNMVIAFAVNRSSVGFNGLHFKLADAFLEN